jgi:hypothetical protein
MNYPIKYKDNLVTKDTFIHLNIYVTETQYFTINTLDLFSNKKQPLTFSTYKSVREYIKEDISFWKNQLKFAVYCATSGCGISWDEDINHKVPFIKSIFRFHTYYTIRKILHQMEIPLPLSNSFNENNNPYNKQEYEKIKREFGLSNFSFDYLDTGKIKVLDLLIKGTNYLKHPFNFPFNKDVKEYNYADKRHRIYINSFQFSKTDDWTNFIPTNSSSLTYQGIVRLNESIRTYVYCVLGAQAEARSAIIGSFGTELDHSKISKIYK